MTFPDECAVLLANTIKICPEGPFLPDENLTHQDGGNEPPLTWLLWSSWNGQVQWEAEVQKSMAGPRTSCGWKQTAERDRGRSEKSIGNRG